MTPKDPAGSRHEPVLLSEAMDGLQLSSGKIGIDCTLGGGGHTASMLEAVGPTGTILGLDADPAAIERVMIRHQDACESNRLLLIQSNFGQLEIAAAQAQIEAVDSIFFDLGLSSFQLETHERGFSFQNDGPLDMRFDPDQAITAADIVNTWPHEELANLLYIYGEERHSRTVAKRIIGQRPLRTTLELADVVKRAVPKPSKYRIHPATRTFQALRIAVNEELIQLERALAHSIDLLKPAGRVVVISFHSLEDRIVKQWMRSEAQTFVRDDTLPMGGYDKEPTLRLINRKPIGPSHDEMERNPRSRSAKMRVAERV